MEGVLALLIPVIPVTVGGIWLFGKTALGAALIRRIDGRGPSDPQDLEAVHDELDQLRDQVAQLRDENADVLERLDFTERLLSKARTDSSG